MSLDVTVVEDGGSVRHAQGLGPWLARTAPKAARGELTVAIVGDRKMQALNRQFRGKNAVTDVLSFPAEQDQFEKAQGTSLGDVVISVEQAARQAKQNGLTLDEEIAQLILHGLIHLCGYDHSTDNGEMNRLELRLRRKLKI